MIRFARAALLAAAAFALEAGQFSEVIADDTHYRILNVVARRDGTAPPLSEVREGIVEALQNEAFDARIRGWIAEAEKRMDGKK